MIIKITADNFNDEVINKNGKILVDFYADWCGPCKMISPIIEEIANEMGIMVEDDIYQAFMNEYQERLCDCCLDDFDTFKEEIISTMFDLGLCAE